MGTRVSEWKAANAPNRSLKPAELSKLRENAKAEYAAMTFAEFADWQAQHQQASRASKKRRAPASAAAALDDSKESLSSTGAVEACGPLWNQESVVDGSLFSAENSERLVESVSQSAPTAAGKVFDIDPLLIKTAPRRTTRGGHGWGPIWGCASKVQNVCRDHRREDGEDEMRQQLDVTLLPHITSWVRSLGRDRVDRVNDFVWFHTPKRGADGKPLDRVCLLGDAVYKPMAQYFTLCWLPDTDAMCFDPPSVLPFRLRIGFEESNFRMRGCKETLCTRTSDELAMDLLRDAGSDWQLLPLQSEPDCGSASLLDCIVTGVLEAVPIPVVDKKLLREQARVVEQQVLQLQHPLSPDAGGCGAGHADILAEHPLCAEDSEGSDWQELLNDARAIHVFVGAAEESQEESRSRSSSCSRSASDEEDDSAGAAEALEESIFRASVDPVDGAVTSSTPPWNDFPVVGVYSEYPRTEVEEQRKMIMRCKLHGNGRQCFLMRSRARGFTKEFMLRWLFAGLRAAPAAKVSDAESVQKAARAHKSLADGIAQ